MIPETSRHIPVLLDEVIAALAPQPGECHVDGTYGAGGYARAIHATGARVIAFDRDPTVSAPGEAGISLIHDRFSNMAAHLDAEVDGVTLDIGVSSMQIDEAVRGFSFQADGPLDMRMELDGDSAADFVNTAEEADIAGVIFRYGEEPKSRRIARAIVGARPILTTGELARIVRKATGWRDGDKKDPATRTFQAIRIHINRELEELEGGLAAAELVLRPGGRLAIVTFHSLEDRIVKRFLRERSGSAPAASRHVPVSRDVRLPSFASVAKPVRPGQAELARNPRSRSATLRFAKRTEAPAWSDTKEMTR